MQVIKKLCSAERNSAVALGYFDGVHIGHRNVICAAAAGSDSGLVPAVFTFLQLPKNLLSNGKTELLQTFSQKAKMLESLGIARLYCMDFREFRNMEPKMFVAQVLHEQLKAKKVFCGFNYHFGRNGIGSSKDLQKLCAPFGIEVSVAEPVVMDGDVVSSTRIRTLLKEGMIAEANRLLGYDFGIESEIIHGNHIGKGLGFPTVNQNPGEGLLLPKFGVYASVVTIDGKKFCGVTNVGVKPTVGKYNPLYETWMPLYTGGDLYGKTVDVRLKEFLRPERRFQSLQELKDTVLENGRQALELVKL